MIPEFEDARAGAVAVIRNLVAQGVDFQKFAICIAHETAGVVFDLVLAKGGQRLRNAPWAFLVAERPSPEEMGVPVSPSSYWVMISGFGESVVMPIDPEEILTDINLS